MKRKMLTVLLLLSFFNLTTAQTMEGWQSGGTEFDYYIQISSGTERPAEPPRYQGSKFVYDIDLFRTKTGTGEYIDPFTGNPAAAPSIGNEFYFCWWQGTCRVVSTVSGKLQIVSCNIDPDRVTQQPEDVDATVAVKNLEIMDEGVTVEISIIAPNGMEIPGNSQTKTIVGNGTETFVFSPAFTVGEGSADWENGNYVVRAKAFDESGSLEAQAICRTLTVYTVSPAAVPETNDVLLPLVALAVLLVIALRRKN